MVHAKNVCQIYFNSFICGQFVFASNVTIDSMLLTHKRYVFDI